MKSSHSYIRWNKQLRWAGGFVLLGILLFILFGMNVCIGTVSISVRDIGKIIVRQQNNEMFYNIIWKIRFPRAIAAMVLGGGLALSGYLLQTFFHNPIAGPFVLGISSGAKLVVAVVMIVFVKQAVEISSWTLIGAAFIGAMLAMGLVLLMSGRIQSMSRLVISGIMIGYICSAITEFLVAFAEEDDIVNLHSWSMGSFSGITWANVKIITIVVGITSILVFFMAKPMYAYQLGEGYAKNMGVNIVLFRMLLVLFSSVLSACVTAFAGPISFVGIAVPQLVKMVLHSSKPILMIPASILGGAVFCLACDLLARTLLAPTELSISAVTAVFGAPVVIAVMLKKKGVGKVEEIYFQTKKMTIGYQDMPIIRDIEIAVKRGEIFTLIGPNGAGKTTMIKSIVGQLKLLAGTIYLNKESVEEISRGELAKKMAVVLTDPIKTELFTCEEMVATGRYPYTGRFGILTKKDWKFVAEAMECVHVTELKDRDFREISDGQKQRVMLARAICQKPEILILDEPTSYLDIRYKLDFMSALQQMTRKENITVILSLHELDLADRISDRIMCVRGEYVDRIGTPEEIFQKGYIHSLYGIQKGSFDEEQGRLELPRITGTPKIFVLAGGGNGASVYRTLQRRGIPFATGILQENDIDYPVARALAQKVISQKFFTRISEETYLMAKQEIDKCEKVYCAIRKFGELNRENYKLMEYAKKAGKLVDLLSI